MARMRAAVSDGLFMLRICLKDANEGMWKERRGRVNIVPDRGGISVSLPVLQTSTVEKVEELECQRSSRGYWVKQDAKRCKPIGRAGYWMDFSRIQGLLTRLKTAGAFQLRTCGRLGSYARLCKPQGGGGGERSCRVGERSPKTSATPSSDAKVAL